MIFKDLVAGWGGLGSIAVALALCLGCSNSPSADPVGNKVSAKGELAEPGRPADVKSALRFRDVTRESGLDFTYHDGQEAELFTLLETLGGGLAACDVDGDGAIDLVIAGGGRFVGPDQVAGLPPGCFRNDGTGHFTEISLAAGMTAAAHYSHGIAAGDYDNDGFPDLVMTGYDQLAIYRNNGDGTFSVAEPADVGLVDSLWSSSAGWGDLDGDGNLDLYVVHYVDWSFTHNPICRAAANSPRDLCTPKAFEPLPDSLYMSRGDGTFQNVSQDAGLRTDGKGLGVVISDLDADGRVDIFVCNDTTPNFLYRNLGGGQLQE
ncbi:MAG: VCBS repeat-containing protein, partial [Planctomycetes bacterium]|nr:VCBS repeat-containing protein [Planctomycetota bacterium]